MNTKKFDDYERIAILLSEIGDIGFACKGIIDVW